MSTIVSKPLVASPKSYSFVALRQHLQALGVVPADIRYAATPSLAHPASEVTELKHCPKQSTFTIDVSFMGLYGTTSPLPTFYTERVIGNDDDNREVRKFYDLFNHQATSLFYEAWCKYRFPQQYSHDNEDQFSAALLALMGLDKAQLSALKHLGFPDLINIAGLLIGGKGSVEALSQALNQLFSVVSVEISSLSCRHIEIPVDQLNQLGVTNAVLADTLVLGEQVADASGITVWITLEKADQQAEWLPGKKNNEMARELIELMLDSPTTYVIKTRVAETAGHDECLGSRSLVLGVRSGLGSGAAAEIIV